MIGAVLLLIGGFALYAREALFNADAFSRTAAKSLQDEPVLAALADPIVEQIINVGPDQLINAQPLLEGGERASGDEGAFRSAFRDAVRKALEALFRKDRDELVLTIEEANALVLDAVKVAVAGDGEDPGRHRPASCARHGQRGRSNRGPLVEGRQVPGPGAATPSASSPWSG